MPVVAIVEILLIWSATSILGLIIILGGILYNRINKRSRIIGFKCGIGVSLFLFFQIVILRQQQYFRNFIVIVLRRDISFTGRTRVWDTAIGLIRRRPMFGYGINNYIWDYIIPIGNAHNKYLQLLCDGGVFYFIMFLLFLFYIAQRVDKKRKSNFTIQLLIIMCVALLIQMQVEVYKNQMFTFLFIFAFYAEKLSIIERVKKCT